MKKKITLSIFTKKNRCYSVIALFFLSSFTISQEHESQFTLSTNPSGEYWWLNNNNNGKYVHKNNVDFYWRFHQKSTSYQISLSDGFSESKEFMLGESFIKRDLSKDIFLRLGKYYSDFSPYLNKDLTSGSMLISNNAQAIPKIGLIGLYQIAKNEKISFSWGFSHGQLKKNQFYNDAPFLHEKFLYLNFLKNQQSHFSVGIVHNAIWAGTTSQLGDQPDSFKDFLKVIIAADGPLLEGDPHANALGSHMGIWDFYYLKEQNEKTLKLYYQHYFEDTSSLRFANKIDGLWGIELINYISNTNFLIEYLDTSNCCINPPYQQDFYYWNYQYRDGWNYNEKIIGNPFVNSSGSIELTKLIHFGLSSNFKSINFNIKASKKINVGDDIKFRASIDRKIYNNINLMMFLVGDNNNAGFGFSLSYLIRN